MPLLTFFQNAETLFTFMVQLHFECQIFMWQNIFVNIMLNVAELVGGIFASKLSFFL